METENSEQALRREAVRRRLEGESRQTICGDLHRSTRWLDKWWALYRDDPKTDFATGSRAPHVSPQQMPAHVVRAVVAVRRRLEAAATPQTRYGLIGARAIRGELERMKVKPLPSVPTIQRILAAHMLTHPLGAGSSQAYYPWPLAWAVNAIQASDVIVRHLYGGEEINHVHTIDHYSHAVCLTQHANKSSASIVAHLRKCWARLGVPAFHQFDNDASFSGGHTHPRVIGQVVRLCLFCGVEPIFTPVYEAKRNYQIETFHSVWLKAFWSRHIFRNLADVQAQTPYFLRWYHWRYQPPALEGRTPARMRRGAARVLLTAPLQRLLPQGRLPITQGRVHILRKVDATGHVSLLNESWLVGDKWVGEYVRATINTAQQSLTFWHQQQADADWHLIKTRRFKLQEKVHALLPEFRRNRARCRDYWPD